MRYLQYLQNIAVRMDDKYATPPFFLMLVMAFSFHLVLMLGLSLLQVGAPVHVPVKTLMLRLGGADEVEQENELNAAALAPLAPAASSATPLPPVQKKTVSKPVVQPIQKEAPKPVAKTMPQPAPTTTQPIPARTPPTPKAPSMPTGVGSMYGTSRDARAEAVARYEQILSAWIQQHKVYPQEAYASGMQGRVLLRIRIDRAGNVLSRRIEQSSGYSMLDQAVMVAIENANPVPRVPMAYPGGKMLEFRIPIDFKAL